MSERYNQAITTINLYMERMRKENGTVLQTDSVSIGVFELVASRAIPPAPTSGWTATTTAELLWVLATAQWYLIHHEPSQNSHAIAVQLLARVIRYSSPISKALLMCQEQIDAAAKDQS